MRVLARELSLFLPLLADTWDPDQRDALLDSLSLPQRRQWARCDRLLVPESFTECLLLAFDFPEQATPPIASIAAIGMDIESHSDGNWMMVSPVHLHPDRDHLLLFDAGNLNITRQESEALLVTLNDEYADDGWMFHALTPDAWLVRTPQPINAQCVDVDAVKGRSIMAHLPSGEDARQLINLQNEIQMLFNTHDVNCTREAANQAGISGVWLHGPCAMPPTFVSPFDLVISDDATAKGLAKLSGARTSNLSTDISDLLDQSDWQSAAVVVGKAKSHSGPTPSNTDMLVAALKAVSDKQINKLQLFPGDGLCYQFTPRQFYRFWRRV